MTGRRAAAVEGWHVSAGLLERFATVDGPPLPASVSWSIEVHLEHCLDCREELARVLAARSPELSTLVASVHADLDGRLAAQPPAASPVRTGREATRRLTGGLLISRLAGCVAVLVAAMLLDLAADAGGSDTPSWVLLVAPVLPLAGVAASWSRVLDPAYDLVAATPAAGLPMLLRRTLVVLLVVISASLLAAAVAGVGAQATWLLPCVGLTAAALALGSVVGVARATCAVGVAWAVGIVAPALATDAVPAALEPAWLPAWAGLTLVAAAVVAMRRNAYRRLLGPA